MADPLTFKTVYAECFDSVWRSILAMGVRPTDAEDVAQEVFLVVHKKLTKFEGRSSVKTWVTGIMLNTVREYRRARRNDERAIEVNERLESQLASPEAQAVRRASAAFLGQLLDGLSEEQRVVFALSEVQDMTASEVAEALDVKLNTVYSRLRLARAEVDRQLARLRLAHGEEAL